jgi:NAD-dependent dihydropyrimidine dehydrogenase PreA subunit
MDGVFISVAVNGDAASDAALAAKLEEVCPVGIFKGTPSGVEINAEFLDECVLCGLCLDAAPDGAVTVTKLYSGEILTR